MSPAEDSERRERDETVAAEYVLGVLPAAERAAAARRIVEDAAFARLVSDWEQRLDSLNDDYAPADPPAAAKHAIDRQLFGDEATPETARPGWFGAGYWRGFATAAVIALAIAAALTLYPPAAPPQEELLATLQSDTSDVRYAVLYSSADHRIRLAHQHGARPEGHDFELWVIAGDDPPLSLGVIAEGASVSLSPAPDVAGRIAEGATLAISVEPAGGSPSGSPTGPVVAAGTVARI